VAYLASVPAARARLALAGKLSPAWSRLVDAWDEMEACFRAECGEGFCRSEVGERTEGLLRQIAAEPEARNS
jgi:hypothetical protein